jgi:hypothetical protein
VFFATARSALTLIIYLLPSTDCFILIDMYVQLLQVKGKLSLCWTVGVRYPTGAGIFFFSSPPRPDRLRGLLSVLSNGYWGIFPRR